MNHIITISRQYGSGGREIGKQIAQEFGVPYYDHEIIVQAAKDTGFCEEAFTKAEEKASNSLLYSIAMGMNAFGTQEFGTMNLSLDDRIYIAQSDIIRRFAQKGPCVIVGRCADYILRDKPNVVNVFIWAGMDSKVKRATELYELPQHKAAENILKIDKRRANYYNYHTGETWGKLENYQLTIQSDYKGIDHAVECIKLFVK